VAWIRSVPSIGIPSLKRSEQAANIAAFGCIRNAASRRLMTSSRSPFPIHGQCVILAT
jgi:hypothetical protein